MECNRCGKNVENAGLCSDCEDEILDQTRQIRSQRSTADQKKQIITVVMIASLTVGGTITFALLNGLSAARALGGICVMSLFFVGLGSLTWVLGPDAHEVKEWEEAPWWARRRGQMSQDDGFNVAAVALTIAVFSAIGGVLIGLLERI